MPFSLGVYFCSILMQIPFNSFPLCGTVFQKRRFFGTKKGPRFDTDYIERGSGGWLNKDRFTERYYNNISRKKVKSNFLIKSLFYKKTLNEKPILRNFRICSDIRSFVFKSVVPDCCIRWPRKDVPP